jgi:DNA-binding beta-propeller fold protein YncE
VATFYPTVLHHTNGRARLNFPGLPTGLRPDGSADADGAVNTALSPDGTALLILTTGYNTGFDTQGPAALLSCGMRSTLLQACRHPLPRRTRSGCSFSTFAATHPVQKQLINIPNTYHGLVWDPSGTRFYVAGGIDDRVEVFKNSNSGASADGTYVPDAPFVLLNHNQPADVPIQEYPTGGLVRHYANRHNPIAQDMFMPFSALAAGLAISPDGSTLYVANYQNDSLSILIRQPAR